MKVRIFWKKIINILPFTFFFLVIWLYCIRPFDPPGDKMQISFCKDKSGNVAFKNGDTLWIGDTTQLIFKVNRWGVLKSIRFHIDKGTRSIFDTTLNGPFLKPIINPDKAFFSLDTAVDTTVHSVIIEGVQADSTSRFAISMLVKGRKPTFENGTISLLNTPVFQKPCSLKIRASGSPFITYRWTSNGKILNSSKNLLVIGSMDTSNLGEYRCMASNKYGSVASKPCSISVIKYPPKVDPTILISPPVPELGKHVQLKVIMHNSQTPPYTYTWKKDGSIVSTAKDLSILSIDTVALKHLGKYVCVVTNEYGSDSTQPTLLTISKIPLLSPKNIFIQPDTSVNKPFVGDSLRLFVNAFCSQPFTYFWYKDGSKIDSTESLSFKKLTLANSGVYQCVVSNSYGADTSLLCSLRVLSPSPATIIMPKNIDTIGEPIIGKTFSLSIKAQGSSPINYIWFKDTTALDTTTDNFLILSISLESAGSYSCIVFNRFGSDTSNPLTLKPVFEKIALDNNGDLVFSGKNIKDSLCALEVVLKSGYVTRYQWYKDDVQMQVDTTINKLIFSNVQFSDSGEYYCVVSNKSDFKSTNKYYLVIDEREGKPKILGFKLSGTQIVDSTCFMHVTANGTRPFTYTWLKDNAVVSSGAKDTLMFTPLKKSDAGDYSCIVSNIFGSDTTKNKINLDPKPHDKPSLNPKTISQIGAPVADSTIVLSVSASGSPTLYYDWYKRDSLVQSSIREQLVLSPLKLTSSGIYKCIVRNPFGSDTSLPCTLSIKNGQIPFIYPKKAQKQKPFAIINQSYFLYVKLVAGQAPLSYRWFKNNSIIPIVQTGLINDTLTFSNIRMNDAGTYYCIVNNAFGSDTSLRCTVSVVDSSSVPPTFINVKKTIDFFGQNTKDSIAILHVSVQGSQPMTFQWFKNDNAISSSQNDSLVFSKLAFSDSGTYTCKVSNNFGRDSSAPFLLKVLAMPAPKIVNSQIQFLPQTPVLGQAFKMYVSVNGSANRYRWFKNGSLLSTATTDTVKLARFSLSDEATYYCIVSNNVGSDTSKEVKPIHQNRPPVWNSNGIFKGTVREGRPFTLSLVDSCKDEDGDTLSFSILSTTPHNLNQENINTNKVLRIVPGFRDAGVYTIKLQASDGKVQSTATLTLTVLNSNQPPSFSTHMPDTLYTINEGDIDTIPFQATDLDSDKVSFSVGDYDLPKDAFTFDSSRQRIIWPTRFNYTPLRKYYIDIKASDAETTVTKRSYTSVVKKNFPPSFLIEKGSTPVDSNATLQVNENSNLSLTITATDTNITDKISFTAENLPQNLSFDSLLEKKSGDNPLVYKFTYKPGFKTVQTPQTSVTFSNVTFIANDNNNLPNSRRTFKINIVVKDKNTTPTVSNISKTIGEGQSADIDIIASDQDGDTLTWSIDPSSLKHGKIKPTKGTISDGPEFTYQATDKQPAVAVTDTASIIVKDIANNSDTALFSITINPNNDPPVIDSITPRNPVVLSDTQTSPVSFNIYARDPESQSMSWSRVTDPQKGTLSVLTSSIITGPEFTYTLKPGQIGDDTFSIFCTDAQNIKSSTVQIKITINHVNRPPVVTIPNGTINEDSSYALNLNNCVTDPDNTPAQMSWDVVKTPNNFSVSINKDKIATITPKPGKTGSETISFKATDPQGASGVGSGNFTINKKPVVTINNATINEGSTYTLNLDTCVSDDDPAAQLSWSTSSSNSFKITITNHLAAITVLSGQSGSDAIIFTAKDPKGASGRDTVTFTINKKPVVKIPDASIKEGQSYTLNLDTCVTDDDPISSLIWKIPTSTLFDIKISDRTVVISPISGKTGSDNLEFTATDPKGASGSDKGLFTIVPQIAPVVTIPSAVIKEGDSYTLKLDDCVTVGTDPAASLTWSASDAVNFEISIAPATRIATITPKAGFSGSENISFTATDTQGKKGVGTGKFTSNLKPVITLGDQTIPKDSIGISIKLDESVKDENIITLKWDIPLSTDRFTLTRTGNLLSIKVKPDSTGSDTIKVTVTDELDQAGSKSVILTVASATRERILDISNRKTAIDPAIAKK